MKIEKENLILAWRVIFALVLLAFGFNHMSSAEAMAPLVPSFLPGWIYWVYLTWICLILAWVSIMFNQASWASWIALAVFLWIVIVTVHIPSMSENPMAMANILKDLAIAAWWLIIAWLDSTFEDAEKWVSIKKASKKRK